jgi:hypothetical protein
VELDRRLMATSHLGSGQTYATFASWAAAVEGNTGAEDAICHKGVDLGDLTINAGDTWMPSSSTIDAAVGEQHRGKIEPFASVYAYTAGAIFLEANNIIFRHMIVYNGSLILNSNSTGTRNMLVEKCLFDLSTTEATQVGTLSADGGGVATTVNATFRNNVIYWTTPNNNGGGSYGFYVANANSGDLGSTLNWFFYNNSIVSTQTTMDLGVHVEGDASTGIMRNNMVAGAVGNCYDITDAIHGVTVTSSNNWSTDGSADDYGGSGHKINQVAAAHFTDPATDLTLLTTSTARNAGVTIAGFADDIVGTARPQNSAWDMGAFEVFVEVTARLRRLRVFRFWRH